MFYNFYSKTGFASGYDSLKDAIKNQLHGQAVQIIETDIVGNIVAVHSPKQVTVIDFVRESFNHG